MVSGLRFSGNFPGILRENHCSAEKFSSICPSGIPPGQELLEFFLLSAELNACTYRYLFIALYRKVMASDLVQTASGAKAVGVRPAAIPSAAAHRIAGT